jgi:hypothetical protein
MAASRWSTMIHSRRLTPEEGEQSIRCTHKNVCWLVKRLSRLFGATDFVVAFDRIHQTVAEPLCNTSCDVTDRHTNDNS